jgi:hypothetical protein
MTWWHPDPILMKTALVNYYHNDRGPGIYSQD